MGDVEGEPTHREDNDTIMLLGILGYLASRIQGMVGVSGKGEATCTRIIRQ